MPDQLFFKLLSEAFPALTEAELSERWKTHAKIPSWSSLPTETKLGWAQVTTLARISASEDFEEMIELMRTLRYQPGTTHTTTLEDRTDG